MENAEVIFQWFFLIKIALGLTTVFFTYKAFKEKFKSMIWNMLTIVFIVLTIVAPFKMDLNTKATIDKANAEIMKSKELPSKVTDDSFKKETNKSLKITQDELK